MSDKFWQPDTNQRFKNQVIDQINNEREITLAPGETWQATPRVREFVASDYCYHVWKDVALFTTSVTQCEKCGITERE